MFFPCTCGTLARGKFFFFFGKAEQEHFGNGKEPKSRGHLRCVCNCTPYCFIETLLILCQGTMMSVLRSKGLVRSLRRTRARPYWCGSVMMAFLLNWQQEGILLAAFFLSAFPTRKDRWSNWDRIFFQLQSMHISFQPLPMRNMILSDLVVLRQIQPTKDLGVHC